MQIGENRLYGTIASRRCVLWIQQAVQLRTARFQLGSHGPFCLLLPDHLLLKLPGMHALDRDAFYFVSVSFLFQEIIETRSAVYIEAGVITIASKRI
jgi:hypothetical protein